MAESKQSSKRFPLVGRDQTFVIIDDAKDIRTVFKWYAENYGLKVVGEAGDGKSGLSILRELKPFLAVIDLMLPEVSGVDVIARIHREYPRMKLVALTGQTSGEAIESSIAAGACAHLVKPISPEEFAPIMDRILQDHHSLSSSAVDILWKWFGNKVPYAVDVQLTGRQTEVVALVVAGLTNKEIASRLSISVRTVEKYRAEAMERLGVRSTVELVRYATTQDRRADRFGGGGIYHTLTA